MSAPIPGRGQQQPDFPVPSPGRLTPSRSLAFGRRGFPLPPQSAFLAPPPGRYAPPGLLGRVAPPPPLSRSQRPLTIRPFLLPPGPSDAGSGRPQQHEPVGVDGRPRALQPDPLNEGTPPPSSEKEHEPVGKGGRPRKV